MTIGFEILIAAITDVFANWRQALRILIAPLAVLIAVSVWANQTAHSFQIWVGLIAVLVDFFFLTVVAVGWHRFILLEENPGALTPRLPVKAMFAYFISWFAVTIIIALSLTAIGAVLFFGYKLLEKTGIFDRFVDFSTMVPESILVGAFFFVFTGVWALTYALFRLGMRLPARAAFGKSIGLDASRVLTKPIAGALAVTSALIAGITVLVAYVPELFFEGSGIFVAVPTPAQTITENIGYGVTVLLGAAVLNEVFRRSVPHDELAREVDEQRES